MAEQKSTSSYDRLTIEWEHEIHSFLAISEVFALQRVSSSWRNRIGRTLRELPWHAHHREDVDDDAHVWLQRVVSLIACEFRRCTWYAIVRFFCRSFRIKLSSSRISNASLLVQF